MERTKDTTITFKNTVIGKNSKGADRIQLSMDQQQTALLLEALVAHQENERGVKLDIHIKEQQTHDGSKSFLSGFAFVKPIQAFGANRGGATGGKVKYVPKGQTATTTGTTGAAKTNFQAKLNNKVG